MSDIKGSDETHGISSAIEVQPHVVAGYGQTTKREGAKTKEVHNVSSRFPTQCSLTDPENSGRFVCCY